MLLSVTQSNCSLRREAPMNCSPEYLRRGPAAQYLKSRYGFGTEKTLAKEHSLGTGPAAFKAGRIVLYRVEDLDRWAQARISSAAAEPVAA